MKYYLSVLFFLSFPTLASSQINFLNIVGDVVEFSLVDGKEHQIPQCVSSENADLYAVSLTSESGRAIYSLLITAMASQQAISVETDGSCIEQYDVEHAKGVNIHPKVTSEIKGTSALYLFKGDGNTMVGRIVSANNGLYYYASVDNLANVGLYDHSRYVDNKKIYFESTDCTGTPYTESSAIMLSNPLYQDGHLIRTVSGAERRSRLLKSVLKHDIEICYTVSSSVYVYEAGLTEDPVCGDKPCIVKEL